MDQTVVEFPESCPFWTRFEPSGYDVAILLVQLTSAASSFLEQRHTGTATEFPEHPSLGIRCIEATTQWSSCLSFRYQLGVIFTFG